MKENSKNNKLKHIDKGEINRFKDILPSQYTNPDSIDAWRHKRMIDCIIPIIDFYQNTKWITLGNGRFGTDAYYLQNKGLDVLSTNITDETISIAKRLGIIHKYKEMNAEEILEKDNSFDFVFCKETFHHFSRPYVALYEMIRVAKNGVILIEPQEGKTKLFDFLKKSIKIILRKDSNLNFEESGNYIFKININEFSKILTALNHKNLVYKKLNDFYYSPAANKSIKSLNIFKIITLLGIMSQNLLCKLGLMNYGLVVVVIFKNDINDNLEKILRKNNFQIKKLPLNPYL